MDALRRRLGNNIKQARRKRGLSQQQVAENAHLDLTSVNEIENGRRNPSLETLARLAKVLEVSPHELLKP
ncbi:MAG: helix-turn-helix transcriptional regulator [candidate division WWE3 bacterium]|nr:helix-turn-helix transcriptional regulator [candidate division WWE3 bacterium]